LNDIEDTLRALLVLALDGDNAAYAGFLTRSSECLRSYFRRRLAAFPDDVEDLVQETLLALHNQRHTYRPSERLMPWLYAIARYKLVDDWRARAPRRAIEVPYDDDFDDGAFFAPGASAAEARRDLLKLLEALPDRHRAPIALVKLEGRSVAEAARQLGMSESAVKIGIHRGLKALALRVRRTP
jgi:RNA polymerase sigma-70 factor (ECF subfamily)